VGVDAGLLALSVMPNWRKVRRFVGQLTLAVVRIINTALVASVAETAKGRVNTRTWYSLGRGTGQTATRETSPDSNSDATGLASLLRSYRSAVKEGGGERPQRLIMNVPSCCRVCGGGGVKEKEKGLRHTRRWDCPFSVIRVHCHAGNGACA
jgi:hypothetical protein